MTRERRLEIQAAYRERNKEVLRQREQRRREANREHIRELHRAWSERNRHKLRAWYHSRKDRYAAKKATYREENREALIEKKREWYAANSDRIRARVRTWRKNNQDTAKRADLAKRTREKQAGPVPSKSQLKALRISQKGKCYWCQQPYGQSPHLDHVWPLVKGGTNAIGNLVYACRTCNHRKYDKTPQEFAGRLL